MICYNMKFNNLYGLIYLNVVTASIDKVYQVSIESLRFEINYKFKNFTSLIIWKVIHKNEQIFRRRQQDKMNNIRR